MQVHGALDAGGFNHQMLVQVGQNFFVVFLRMDELSLCSFSQLYLESTFIGFTAES